MKKVLSFFLMLLPMVAGAEVGKMFFIPEYLVIRNKYITFAA